MAPGVWVTVGATWYARSTGSGACGDLNDGRLHFAELGTATRAGVATGNGWLARAFGRGGELPCGQGLYIRYNGRTTYATKADRGYGQDGNGVVSDPHFAIDLYYNLAEYLHFNGRTDVQVSLPVSSPGSRGGAQVLAPTPTPPRKLYYNPIEYADVVPSRVDQGVDYDSRSGYLVAVADGVMGRVSSVPGAMGWPGDYLVYTVTQPGPLDGVCVYYAEGIQPVVHEGEAVRGGARLAGLTVGGSIEIGYADNDHSGESWARAHGGWPPEADVDSWSTRSGIAFNELIKALGGTPGYVSKTVIGEWPPWYHSSVSAAEHNRTGASSAIPGNILSLPSASRIITQDDYSGTVLSIWQNLERQAHSLYTQTLATHEFIGNMKTAIPKARRK